MARVMGILDAQAKGHGSPSLDCMPFPILILLLKAAQNEVEMVSR